MRNAGLDEAQAEIKIAWRNINKLRYADPYGRKWRRTKEPLDIRSPAEGEGNEGFPLPPDKDFESPSSKRLEALVPSRDSRAKVDQW